MSYIEEVRAAVAARNAGQPEFMQAVDEVLNTIRPVVESDDVYKRAFGAPYRAGQTNNVPRALDGRQRQYAR